MGDDYVSSCINEENLKNLSSRAYLESTVVPTVMQGMAELANKKPETLADISLKNSELY